MSTFADKLREIAENSKSADEKSALKLESCCAIVQGLCLRRAIEGHKIVNIDVTQEELIGVDVVKFIAELEKLGVSVAAYSGRSNWTLSWE